MTVRAGDAGNFLPCIKASSGFDIFTGYERCSKAGIRRRILSGYDDALASFISCGQLLQAKWITDS